MKTKWEIQVSIVVDLETPTRRLPSKKTYEAHVKACLQAGKFRGEQILAVDEADENRPDETLFR